MGNESAPACWTGTLMDGAAGACQLVVAVGSRGFQVDAAPPLLTVAGAVSVGITGIQCGNIPDIPVLLSYAGIIIGNGMVDCHGSSRGAVLLGATKSGWCC